MLTQQQKIAVRRHLGIPFAGTAEAGRLTGWRFEIHVEDLEYKLNNMQPSEEQLLTGVSMGSYRISGQPTAGDVLAFTIAGTTVDYTVQPSDVASESPLYTIALNAANAIARNATLAAAGYSAVGVPPADTISPQYLPPYFAAIVVTGPGSASIVLSCSVTGTTNVLTDNPGSQCPVNATFTPASTGQQVTLYGYISVCDYLANAMTQADDSLWLTQADVVKFRSNEVAARRGLYQEYVGQMARAIGGEAYIRKFSRGGRGGAVA